jgi:hypothetical protein
MKAGKVRAGDHQDGTSASGSTSVSSVSDRLALGDLGPQGAAAFLLYQNQTPTEPSGGGNTTNTANSVKTKSSQEGVLGAILDIVLVNAAAGESPPPNYHKLHGSSAVLGLIGSTAASSASKPANNKDASNSAQASSKAADRDPYGEALYLCYRRAVYPQQPGVKLRYEPEVQVRSALTRR